MSDRVAPEVETVGWLVRRRETEMNQTDDSLYLYKVNAERDQSRNGGIITSLVRRSDMETALAAKGRECEELRGELKIQDDANDLLTTIRDNQALIIRKLHKETLTLAAENEKMRGVVENVRVAYREVSDQMRILPQPLHFALAEMDRVMSRAALSKGENDEH